MVQAAYKTTGSIQLMSGIFYVLLAVLASSGLAMTVKTANTKGLPFGTVLAVNYLVATFVSLVVSGGAISRFHSILIPGLGMLIGSLYVLTMRLFDTSIATMGLALPSALMRLSAILPTLGSLLFFNEQLNLYQALGIGLAFASLPLAGNEPLRLDRARIFGLQGLKWGLLLFIVYGVASFIFKLHAEWSADDNPGGFISVIFGTALVLTAPHLFKKNRQTKSALLWGGMLGATNVLATFFLVSALAGLPGFIVYPSIGVGVILFTTLAGLFVWQEKLRPANYAFLCLAGVAVFLINWQ